jgi:hypothetical protein
MRHDVSVGTLYKHEARFEAVPRPETRQEPMASHLRSTPLERKLHMKTPHDGNSTRRTAPHSAWRLHVQLLPLGRVLRAGVSPEFRDHFMVNVCGQLCLLAGLPMGWSFSPFHFCRLTETFVRHLTELSVVLDYIDPNMVPTRAASYFFGWLTPWDSQPHITRETATLLQTEPPNAL